MSLDSFIAAVKQDRNNPTNWFNLGDAASQQQNWKTSNAAYLAGLRLENNEEQVAKFSAARSSYVDALNAEHEFYFEVYKLPINSAVILLVGTLNMDVQGLENAVISSLRKGTKTLVVDFSGIKFLSGLGTSTIKKIIRWTSESGSQLSLVHVPEEIIAVFQLKNIEAPLQNNIVEAFANN